MRYRRAYIPGGMFFFTVVTYFRKKILSHPDSISVLRASFRTVMEEYPSTIDAIVILPDHLHCIWTLPEGDTDFSNRWRLIKRHFSRLRGREHEQMASASRIKKGERAFWQRRFWEHCIRDEIDLMHHVEYIHYNPVKHGLAKAPKDWAYSSFHRYVLEGIYDVNWGAGCVIDFEDGMGGE